MKQKNFAKSKYYLVMHELFNLHLFQKKASQVLQMTFWLSAARAVAKITQETARSSGINMSLSTAESRLYIHSQLGRNIAHISKNIKRSYKESLLVVFIERHQRSQVSEGVSTVAGETGRWPPVRRVCWHSMKTTCCLFFEDLLILLCEGFYGGRAVV
jgi:hypothetical protein